MSKNFIWVSDTRCVIGSSLLDLQHDIVIPQWPKANTLTETHYQRAMNLSTQVYLDSITKTANQRFDENENLWILGTGYLPISLYVRGMLRAQNIFVNNYVLTLTDALYYMSNL